jgi:hypothetical protein
VRKRNGGRPDAVIDGMCFITGSGEIELISAVTFAAVCVGVLVAVLGKAYGKFPYQPDETKVFTRPLLPRWYSKLYVIHPPPRPKRPVAKNHRHENTDS